jgi:GntR family transcriptional regulator
VVHPLSGGIARHRQVASILRNRILGGELPPESQLPTELELTQSYEVSRIVVRQAMQALEFEGLIKRVPGKGTFVRARQAAPRAEWSIGSLEDLVSFGKETRLKVLGRKKVAAPEDAANALQLAVGAPVIEIRSLRSSTAGPLSYQRNYILLDVGRSVMNLDLSSIAMVEAMEKHAGVKIMQVRQWLTAVAAGGEVCSLLKVKRGAPLLQIRRLYLSQERGPVEFGITRFHPDRYAHVSEIRRSG